MTDGNKQNSPRITDCRWSRVSIDGHGTVKDAKLYPGGARAWDWRETGTRHTPGIQSADVAELLDHGAEVVVLSQGVLRMLKVCPETLALLREKGIRVHVLPTGEAVTTYNLLRETERVGALIHSTC
jgi:hypothetical protein